MSLPKQYYYWNDSPWFEFQIQQELWIMPIGINLPIFIIAPYIVLNACMPFCLLVRAVHSSNEGGLVSKKGEMRSNTGSYLGRLVSGDQA